MTQHETRPDRTGVTGRRGFVVAASLGILSLYGLWSAYGAAPGLRLGGEHEADEHGGEAEAGGHGAADGDAEAFRAEAEAYIERHRLPDGSVELPPAAATDQGGPVPHHGGHDGHALAPAPAHGPAEPAPTEVYLLVQQWLFEPSLLRLRAGVPYRFKMLALDVSHGASLQLGLGSRIVRLRPGVPSELLVRFDRPGELLVYCTVYCGLGHDQMHGRIIVA